MELNQTDVTGCRIVGAITKLGHSGPKHHGVILGQSPINQETYVAEIMKQGYQICTYNEFRNRYIVNGDILIEPNDGVLENIAVAQRAIKELIEGGKGAYNLITNNCECFVNRAMYNKPSSQQVINTAIGLAVLAGFVYILKNSK